MTYKFTHDPESGAFYVRLREGTYHETIPLLDPGFGAGVDVDAEGNVLGLEFLSFEEYAELLARHGGVLELPERLALSEEHIAAPFRWEAEHERIPRRYGGYTREELEKALASLSSEEQEVLHLLYFEALGNQEVADRLGTTAARVSRARRAALRNLRDALGREWSAADDATLEAFLATS